MFYLVKYRYIDKKKKCKLTMATDNNVLNDLKKKQKKVKF